ncbi:MAG: energy transducer TonB [Acidiferrobacterales bacterium]
MIKSKIANFLTFSFAVHLAVLAQWSVPSLPTFRVPATLSVGFTTLAPKKTSATTPNAATVPKIAEPQARIKTIKPKAHHKKRAPISVARRTQKSKAKQVKPKVKSPVARPRAVDRTAVESLKASSSNVRIETVIKRKKVSQPSTRAIVKVGTPVVERPWEPVWGSQRYYAAPEHTRVASANPTSAISPSALAKSPAPAERPMKPTASAMSLAKQKNEQARAYIRGRLTTDLSQHFFYPVIARRHGWQGDVRVEFTVEPDGRLTNLRIARSSGYAVLDKSALKALEKVGRLQEARNWLGGRSLDVVLPVIYRLEAH